MDAGPIIAQQEEYIDENAQATTVLPHLFEIGTNLLIDAMPDLVTGKITMDTATPQDESKVVDAAMISPNEAELKVWEESAMTCHNRLRGFSMWPGVFLFVQVEDVPDPIKVKLVQTKVIEEKVEPTDVITLGPNKKDGLRLVCGDGSVLEILQIQPATKRAMDAKSFVNGYPGKTIRWVKPPPE